MYVWGRRHQYVNLSFLGIFNFTAPYLPWVLLAFSVVLGSSPVVDLLGMVAGARHGALNPYARDLFAPARHSRPTAQSRGVALAGVCSLRTRSAKDDSPAAVFDHMVAHEGRSGAVTCFVDLNVPRLCAAIHAAYTS